MNARKDCKTKSLNNLEDLIKEEEKLAIEKAKKKCSKAAKSTIDAGAESFQEFCRQILDDEICVIQ